MTERIGEYEALRARCLALRWQDTTERVFSDEDLCKLDEVYDFAEAAHGSGHMRLSGELYITHPIAVAELLLDIGVHDLDCLMAALLHDVAEDTDYDIKDIAQRFGETAGQMVAGLTKLNKMAFASLELAQAQNVMKMLLAMLKDFRVIIVKLADRLHNMRTLQYKDEAGQRRIANETMYVYVPIADMLGIRLYKEELEDIAIRYLDGPGCREIDEWLATGKEERTAFLEKLQRRLREHLELRFEESGTQLAHGVHVEGRVKSMHGIYRKHYTQHKSFEEIFDIYAVRVIVDTEADCWSVLGWVHQIYREIPKRQKDYISAPKQNGYQSLHLTMVGEERIPFEVQIRTWKMHEVAERGVAGHWKYKQGITEHSTGLEDRLARIQDLIDSYKDADSVEDVVHAIRSDIAPPEKVYPTTPKGETKELKLGATVLDFAYAVHTKVGHRFIGAKVNGRIAPITYQVQSGDVVEILVSPNLDKGPSRDWKHIVVTNQAQSKIRSWFKKERREENIEAGRRELDAEQRRSFSRLTAQEWEEILVRILDRKHFEDEDNTRGGGKVKTTAERIEDFYAALGYGGLNLQSYLPLLREEYQKYIRRQQQELIFKKITSDKGVVVEGIDNCQVKFAQCCYPLPQDDIIGYITRGTVRGSELRPGGVTIHRTSCGNVPRDLARAPEPDRWLQTHWANAAKMEYLGAVTIHNDNKRGILADVTMLLKNLHVDISNLHSQGKEDGTGIIFLVIGVTGRKHLESICDKIFQLKGVTKVDS